MKHFIPCIALIICIISCSKKEDAKPPEKVKTIQVVEYKTDSPIGAALVEYYNPCPSCGGFGYAKLVFSGRTTAGGYCDVPESIFYDEQYGIAITPTPLVQNPFDFFYLGFGSGAVHYEQKKYTLAIEGEEKIHLIRTSDFPKGYYLEIKARGELASFDENIARVYGLPSDTSFSFVTFRAQTNTITWNIYDSADAIIASGGPILIEFPKSGIHEVEIKY
jgi:hypothetical protein